MTICDDIMVDCSTAVWVSLAAGGLADFSSNLLYAPVDVVVQRLFIQNSEKKQYKNSFGM